MRIKIDINLKDLKINRLIKYFILADLLFLGGWGLVSPVFAIFVIQKIPGATIFTVGLATAIYFITKSLLQMPVAVFLDKQPGEKDDFYVLIFALILAGFSAVAYTLIKTIPLLFAASFLQGLAFALYVPSWSAIFSRHLDKEYYALDWSLDSSTVGFVTGIASFIGAAVISYFGFEMVFVLASILSFASAFLLILLPDLILPKPLSTKPLLRDHTPADINL